MKDTLAAINKMQADGVIGKYAIGGAIGASFYLEPTTSLDIDIFISFKDMIGSQLAPLQPIYDYLRAEGAMDEEPKNEHLMIKGWLVQFLPAEGGLTEEALLKSISADVRGIKTWVMTPEHLIALALNLGRQKDFARVERFIEIGPYDQIKLDDILLHYNLFEKWKKVSDKYMGSHQ